MDPENQDDSPEETPSFHDQLLQALVAKGRLDADILKEDSSVRKQLVQIGKVENKAEKVYRDTSRDGEASTPVNCSERIHLCKAICCKLGFALSEEEVKRGIVQWEPDKPYFKRHDADGYCTHLKRGDCACGVYEDRPQPCHIYSCANDPRIWTDFAKMKLNTEWIEAALGRREVSGNRN
jgi:Fe-S-cluster containining protein